MISDHALNAGTYQNYIPVDDQPQGQATATSSAVTKAPALGGLCVLDGSFSPKLWILRDGIP
jgi:hypothetical protein